MSNTFATELMPRILAGALQVLREEMVVATKVTKDFNGAAGQLGQTVSVAVPQAMDSYSITPAATPPALVDARFLAKTVTIDTWKGSRFNLSSTDMLNYNLQNSQIVPNQIAEAARRLSRDVNQAIFSKYTKIYGWAGNVSASLFASNVNTLSDVDYRLNLQLCPAANRLLVCSLGDRQAALKLDDVKKNPQLAGDTEAYRRASLGQIYAFDVLHDRDIVSHTTGTISAANVTVNANTAKYATSVVVATGVGAAVALKAGDIVQFGSTAGQYNLYAVQADVSCGANTTCTVTLDRPLDEALLATTVVGLPAGFGTGNQDIAGDMAGYALVMRTPGESIEGAPTLGPSITMTDPMTGIPLKLTYLPGYHAAQWELSCLFGVDVIDGRRLVRVGTSV